MEMEKILKNSQIVQNTYYDFIPINRHEKHDKIFIFKNHKLY